MTARLIWGTPDADKTIMYIARVSNPQEQDKDDTKLLRYLRDNGHWSPFEMASACVEVETTRDIARQILRHRSMSFQEFSQRYQDVEALGDGYLRPARLQDTTNRQNSHVLPDSDPRHATWAAMQREVQEVAVRAYRNALDGGIAKEVARAVLPEGLTPSRMYISGTMRSWLHYLQQRLHPSTQLEHRLLAGEILECLLTVAPITLRGM